ncbi:MAG: radical SAM peptide maturase [Macellibacteroides fermentans]|uniref:radical SAM peptide maturase n=1 Tax=Macellibacteroides fermentans TaxID=879969 RepID=UPI003ACF53E7
MIQTLFYTTENNNLYIYDHQFRLSILVHPKFKKVVEKTADIDPYYLRKYDYLKDHGFFSKSKLIDFGVIDESIINNNISQTPQIVFETTDFCNLNCSYCSLGDFYDGFDVRNQKNINTDYAITLLKYIFYHKHKGKNNRLVVSFHGGEPLFNGNFIKKIVEVVNQLKVEKEMEIVYSMTTNATLIHKYIHFLVENKFQLLISLDGNEMNHSYRFFKNSKINSFEKVINNIDMIQSEYSEYFASHVNFNAVLHDRNSVKDIYDFIYLRYNKIPRIAELAPNDVSLDKEDLFKSMYHNKRKSEAEYLKEESNHLPHEELLLYTELTNFLKYFSINYFISNITDLLSMEKRYLPTNTCLPFWKKIMLTTNNKLTLCEKVSSSKFFIGDVQETVKIDMEKIIQRYNSYYGFVREKCESCHVNKFCNVCLFLMDKNNLDKLDKNEFICEGFHNQKAFEHKLYRVFSFLEKYPNDSYSIIENVVIS